MMKAYDLPNGLRLQYEEGKAPAGAVEHKCAPRVVAKPAPKATEPVKEEKEVEAKKAETKNKAAAPKNKKAKAATKK